MSILSNKNFVNFLKGALFFGAFLISLAQTRFEKNLFQNSNSLSQKTGFSNKILLLKQVTESDAQSTSGSGNFLTTIVGGIGAFFKTIASSSWTGITKFASFCKDLFSKGFSAISGLFTGSRNSSSEVAA